MSLRQLWQQPGRGNRDGFRGGLCVVWSLRRGVLLAVLEAVALAVHLEDVDVVGEAVQQRAGEALRSEHLGPLVEWEVGGHQDGASLVALAEDIKEQFRTGAGEWDESQFVDDQQVDV